MKLNNERLLWRFWVSWTIFAKVKKVKSVKKLFKNAFFLNFCKKLSLCRSTSSTESSIVFIHTHLVTTFSNDSLILTTSKPIYVLCVDINVDLSFLLYIFSKFCRMQKPSSWHLVFYQLLQLQIYKRYILKFALYSKHTTCFSWLINSGYI